MIYFDIHLKIKMMNKLNLKYAVPLLAGLILAVAANSQQVQPKKENLKNQVKQYTCPMHSEIIQDKPGKCPKCGMDLVLKTDTGYEMMNSQNNSMVMDHENMMHDSALMHHENMMVHDSVYIHHKNIMNDTTMMHKHMMR
jgi:hypothetical protein